MTKNKKVALFILVALTPLLFLKKEAPRSMAKKESNHFSASINEKSSSRKVIDQNRKPIERTPASSSYMNKPSPEWKKRLETSLKAQAGNSLKSIKIQKESSLVWMRDENPILVESVIVTLTNHQKMQSSFRALVDSQTGKVLESWDQTIFDPANVRDGFHFKLDPRYTNSN
jgi:hypothetical protein